MVLDFYNLDEQPFGVTPDPRYLYLSPTHREAAASLLYGITSGRGFVSLIAKPGMGKTTLLFQVLKSLQGSARTVFLFQTLCSPTDFLKSLLADLGVEHDDGDLVHMHWKLNDVLVRESKSGKRFVVIIDEAQNLDDSVLEVVRMLSNFETPREKLMQIVLAGQPQLANRLASPNLVQLRQRISIFCRLTPFTVAETGAYIDCRLRIAGYDSKTPLFTERACALIAAISQGIPRNINNICFNALSLGYVQKLNRIDQDVIQEVAADLDLEALKADAELVPKPAESRSVTVVQGPTSRSAVRWRLRLADLIAGLAIATAVIVALAWGGMTASRERPAIVNLQPPLAGSVSVNASQEKVASPNTVAPASEETKTGAVMSVNTPTSLLRETDPVVSSDSSSNAQSRGGESRSERSIIVEPNETLYGISRQYFGSYNPSIAAKIRELNPEMKNPNFILSGHKLRIPSTPEPSSDTSSAVRPVSNPSAVQVERP